MQIPLANGVMVCVDVLRRNVRLMRLRVFPDGTVRITVPTSAHDNEIRAFLLDHAAWIQRYLQMWGNSDAEGTVRVEGRLYRLQYEDSEVRRVQMIGDQLKVSGPSHTVREKTLDSWWRQHILAVSSEYFAKWFPVLAEMGHRMPAVSVRKMRTTWGSCTPSLATIRLNYYLLSVPRPEIEYVVLHELAHLEYPNHGENFRTFMTRYMPDWISRRADLNAHVCYIPNTSHGSTQLKGS